MGRALADALEKKESMYRDSHPVLRYCFLGYLLHLQFQEHHQ